MMVDTNQSFSKALEHESWILYSIGMAFIGLRLYSRARRVGGPQHYQADDYLQLCAACLFTILIAILNVIVDNGGSNLFPPEDLATMSASEKDERIEGSKLVLVSEQAMLNLIYTLKTCVLILYTRLTLGLSARRFVRWISLYVAIGWTATQITMFTACRPFSGYWAVPPPNRQCATFEHYAILQGWFNISSDTLMLMVPLPLIFKMSVCWRQKVVLVFIFSLGICVIVAALLTKIFNLGDPYSPNYMLWYIREASVAVYVSNLPLVWPLLREWFPWLRDLKTAGVLPTPAAVAAAAQAKREKEQKLNQTSAADTSQTASPDRPGVGTIRRDTFADFGAWLRPVDLELRKPPRAALASSSRERILGDPDSPGRNKAKRISRFKENIIEEIGYDDPTPRTLDLERGDFIWEIRDHYGQPSTPGARD